MSDRREWKINKYKLDSSCLKGVAKHIAHILNGLYSPTTDPALTGTEDTLGATLANPCDDIDQEP
jgi:hypothetical protein